MKITDVKVWLVQGIKYNWTLLKIYTDEGLKQFTAKRQVPIIGVL